MGSEACEIGALGPAMKHAPNSLRSALGSLTISVRMNSESSATATSKRNRCLLRPPRAVKFGWLLRDIPAWARKAIMPSTVQSTSNSSPALRTSAPTTSADRVPPLASTSMCWTLRTKWTPGMRWRPLSSMLLPSMPPKAWTLKKTWYTSVASFSASSSVLLVSAEDDSSDVCANDAMTPVPTNIRGTPSLAKSNGNILYPSFTTVCAMMHVEEPSKVMEPPNCDAKDRGINNLPGCKSKRRAHVQRIGIISATVAVFERKAESNATGNIMLSKAPLKVFGVPSKMLTPFSNKPVSWIASEIGNKTASAVTPELLKPLKTSLRDRMPNKHRIPAPPGRRMWPGIS
mmetsp:Transcript_97217/g.251360  ORF Transcript_97217/g.251360 Transcript_97217/m.251360 type:complete len:345 (-) Transcript_97217:170-1204(-)